MVNQLSQNQLKLRYLLHGNPENFNNQDWLYLLAESDELWQKVARELFAQNNESWRIIETILANQITPDKRPSLNIKILSRDSVIEEIKKDIDKNGISSLNVELLGLTSQEREDILSEIGKNQHNKGYWLKLPLHETLDGKFITISDKHIYLQNPNFTIPEKLQSLVTIIKRSETLDQKWIEQWTPKKALEIILEENQPSQYCSIILDCLSKLNDQEKTELIPSLKTKQWLTTNNQHQSAISPNNLLYISDNHLENHIDKIVDLNQGKYAESILDSFIRDHSEYKWLISDLFDKWDTKKIIKFVLEKDNPENYWDIILDAVKTLKYNLDQDIEDLIKKTNWLPVNGGTPKKPNQIIDLAPIKPLEPLKKYLLTLVELSEDAYASVSMLLPEIQQHEAFNWLKENKYFLNWYQNNIIDFILNLPQPHQHCEIILATINNLLSHNQQISSNNSESLKQKAWLIDLQKNRINPQRVIYYPDLSEEINHILYITQNSEYIDYSQLDDQIKESQFVVEWLSKNCFLSEKDAFGKIGELIANIPEYQLGLFDEFPLQECLGTKNELGVFQGIPLDILPCWSLVETITHNNTRKFKEYILPALLNEIQEDRLINLFNWLSDKHTKPNESVISVYNQYLTIACNYSNFSSYILPKIKLLNKSKKWINTNFLCDQNKVANIDEQYILNNCQRRIIESFLDNKNYTNKNIFQNQTGFSAKLPSPQYDQHNNYEILKDYCQYLENYINQSELIGCFLSLLSGNDIKVQKLAQTYLGHREFIDIIERILSVSETERFTFENITFIFNLLNQKNKKVLVTAITGNKFETEQSETNLPNILFTGEPEELLENEFRLNLVPYQRLENSDIDLITLVKESTKWVLRKVYVHPDININNFEEEWNKLSSSDQLDITFAQQYILNGITYLLDTLKLSNDYLSKQIKEYKRYIYQVIDTPTKTKEQKEQINKYHEERQGIQHGIRKLFQDELDEQNVIRDTFNDIQKKISEHGYSQKSIPFELFQNADDALLEWQIISGQELSLDNNLFTLISNSKELNFMHWGRPINCFRHRNNPNIDYSEKGFDFDLVKMLIFNNSDKKEDVTGKFGLGFKSVYLVCDQPYILSGDLGFKVVAGLLPDNLPIEYKETLRQTLEIQNPDLNNGTIIHLRLNSYYQGKSEEITSHFYYLAGILLVFAKRIKQCRLINSETNLPPKELSWQPNQVLDIEDIEFGYLEIKENPLSNSRWLTKQALCLKIEEKASLLLCFKEDSGKIKSSLPSDIPTLWVTAPTTEKLELGFLLNAQFNITTGRQKFIESEDNKQLAEEIGHLLGKQLFELFNASQGYWNELKKSLDLQNINEYDFWYFIWLELAEKWLHKDSNYALDIIRLVLGGNCGMGYFITHCPSLPNGLWGDYQKLISVDKTRYIVTGILATQNCFDKVSTWTEFTKRCLNNIVNELVWNNVKLLLGDYFNFQQTEELKLIDVLKWELGEQLRAIPTVAEKLGQLITKTFLSEWYQESSAIWEVLKIIRFQAEDGKFYASYKLLSKYYLRPNLSSNNYYEILGIPYNAEIHDIKKAYRSLARKYHPDVNKEANADEQFKKINSAYETLSDTEKRYLYDRQHKLISKMVKTEEQLLADFAPQSRLLNNDYVDIALDFFFICRDKLEDISIEELAQWVWEANTESQREAVITYLEIGEKASTLAQYLQGVNRNSWLKENSKIKKILDDIVEVEEIKKINFKEYRENQNNNNFSQPETSTTNTPNSYSPINTPVSSKPIITLKHIYEWWKNLDRDQYIKKYYEDLIYPIKTSDLRKKLKLEDRNYWMMLFFLGLTHRIGRTKYIQHRDFINFCRENKNWWSSFSSPQPKQKSEQWMNVLNEYFGNKNLVEEIKWLYWMEKFPVIYQISCYLDKYIQVFTDVDKIKQVFNLKHITAVRGSYIFDGTEIDAPPLMLGMGANFIIRELVRLEVIKSTPYIIEHCFVPKGNVRRFLTMLGCPNLREWTPDTSKNINRFLCEQFRELGISEEEVTFNNAFDLPFQLLADNPKLRQEVLQQDIALDTFEIDENEFYYDYED